MIGVDRLERRFPSSSAFLMRSNNRWHTKHCITATLEVFFALPWLPSGLGGTAIPLLFLQGFTAAGSQCVTLLSAFMRRKKSTLESSFLLWLSLWSSLQPSLWSRLWSSMFGLCSKNWQGLRKGLRVGRALAKERSREKRQVEKYRRWQAEEEINYGGKMVEGKKMLIKKRKEKREIRNPGGEEET